MTDTLTGHDVEEGELPEGWEVRELRELVDVLDSRRKPVNATERADRPGDVPYYGATGQVGTIDEALFDEDLVLLGEDGVQFFDPDKQKAYEISGPAWVNNHAHVLRCNQDLYQQSLLIHFLNQADYRNRANGTTRLKLTQAAMKEIPVLTPPMDEQERIVEILEAQLSRLDTALQSVRTVREKAAQFRRSLLHAAFTGALTGHDVEEGELPNGWESARFGDVADFVRGVTYKKAVARDAMESGYMALLRATNLQDDSIDYGKCVYVPQSVVKPEQWLCPNDLVVATSSGSSSVVGKSGPVVGAFEGTFGAFCAVIRPHEGIRARYLHLFAQSSDVRQTWSDLARGTNINNLKEQQMLSTVIPVAPLDEQGRIVEILEDQLSRLDASLAVADEVEEHSAALRRSLLHSAFTGRLTRVWREAVDV